jgi:uncharacterized OB-fold protein
MSTTVAQSPVAEGLFRRSAGGVELIGSRCVSCGTYYFPTALSCRNPGCDEKQIVPSLMGRQGTLYSYTIQGYRPPALFRMDPWQPYALGLVELPEGLRVMSMLTGFDPGAMDIGTAVELTVVPLYTDSEGREVLTYSYRPIVAGAPV